MLTVAEIVLKIIALGFQDIKALVLDLPPGAAGGGKGGNIIGIDGQIGDEGIAIGDLALGIGDLEF